MDSNDRLTIGEAARILGVHPNTVRHRVKKRLYPTEKALTPHGEAYLLPRALIEAEAQQQAPAAIPSNGVVPSPGVPEEARHALALALQEALVPLLAELRQARADVGDAREELGRARARIQHLEGQLEANRKRRSWLRRLLGLQ